MGVLGLQIGESYKNQEASVIYPHKYLTEDDRSLLRSEILDGYYGWNVIYDNDENDPDGFLVIRCPVERAPSTSNLVVAVEVKEFDWE